MGVLALAACGAGEEKSGSERRGPDGGEGRGPDGGAPPAPWESGERLPDAPAASGDAVEGRRILLNGNYMSCGLPYKLWENPLAGPLVRDALGQGRPSMPGREGKNADVPYSVNVFTTVDGAEVVNLNCLHCHGGMFDGELIVGLGDPTRDFTSGMTGIAGIPAGLIPEFALDLIGLTEAEKNNTEILLRTARAVGNQTVTRTIGNNPADSLARVLAEHRDPETLAWSEEPLIEVTFYGEDGEPLEDSRFTSDPPPWWRVHKKNALFYNGMTRGDKRGTMAAAAAICVNDLAEAERIDSLFVDIQSYVESIRAPRYSRPIDRALAVEGEALFLETCAGCHGTYGDAPDDSDDTYPNLLIPLEVIGTDPVIAEVGTVHAANVFEVYNTTFYGSVTALHPGEPFPGYTPPPLDGVWATAPFLHNASVPNVALVLNSAARPRYWKRVDYDSTNFDEENLGWPYVEVPYSQAEAPEAEKKYIYDTTVWSQGNGGHTFGDAFTDAERRAVIEYLKTL